MRRRGGTLAFAAPEVLRGRAADAWSDQWSFCVALWQTLEGVLPFCAESSDQLLETILHKEPWSISTKVPEQLRDVLRVGLSIDPRERFPDMHALLRALEAVRRAEPEAVGDTDDELSLMLTPPKRRARKGPGWGMFVAGMLVSGSVVFAVTSVGREQVQQVDSLSVATSTAAEPCSLERPDQLVRPSVREICTLIRAGQLELASSRWEAEHNRRRGQDDEIALADDTLIVALTFVDQAEQLMRLGVHAEARLAAAEANEWATQAAGSHGVEDVFDRAKAVAGVQ